MTSEALCPLAKRKFQTWILLLMVIAFTSISVMSVGLDLTNHVFSYAVKYLSKNTIQKIKQFRVEDMERDFGPLWPFNIAVVSFFTAAFGIWFDHIF